MKTNRTAKMPQYWLFLRSHPHPLPPFPSSPMKIIRLHLKKAKIDPFLKDLHAIASAGRGRSYAKAVRFAAAA